MEKAVYGERCGMKAFLDERLNDLLAVYKRYIIFSSFQRQSKYLFHEEANKAQEVQNV
jgi:hypothetical protein